MAFRSPSVGCVVLCTIDIDSFVPKTERVPLSNQPKIPPQTTGLTRKSKNKSTQVGMSVQRLNAQNFRTVNIFREVVMGVVMFSKLQAELCLLGSAHHGLMPA